MKLIKAGVIGASGYAGAELVRLLLMHHMPSSRQSAPKAIPESLSVNYIRAFTSSVIWCSAMRTR